MLPSRLRYSLLSRLVHFLPSVQFYHYRPYGPRDSMSVDKSRRPELDTAASTYPATAGGLEQVDMAVVYLEGAGCCLEKP